VEPMRRMLAGSRCVVAGVALMALSLLAGGCAVAAYSAAMLQPPGRVKAQYKPTTRPMAVLVESYRTQENVVDIGDSLSSLLVREMNENKAADVLGANRVYDLRQSSPARFRTLTVAQVGQMVGAEQVLYVNILRAEVMRSVGNQLAGMTFKAQVKIVNATNGETLWPTQLSEGFLVTVESPLARSPDAEDMHALQEGLARQAAAAIAQLFYSRVIPE
jgi:hypothetical protein